MKGGTAWPNPENVLFGNPPVQGYAQSPFLPPEIEPPEARASVTKPEQTRATGKVRTGAVAAAATKAEQAAHRTKRVRDRKRQYSEAAKKMLKSPHPIVAATARKLKGEKMLQQGDYADAVKQFTDALGDDTNQGQLQEVRAQLESLLLEAKAKVDAAKKEAELLARRAAEQAAAGEASL